MTWIAVTTIALVTAFVNHTDPPEDKQPIIAIRTQETQARVIQGVNPVRTTITPKQKKKDHTPQQSKNKKDVPNRNTQSKKSIEKYRNEKRMKKSEVSIQRNLEIGRQMAAKRGWTGEQWQALKKLWQKESGWNHAARNPSSGAYGIPQALPGRKMASAGEDWMHNPETQIEWGLNYIEDRYGTPLKAWKHSRRNNWY